MARTNALTTSKRIRRQLGTGYRPEQNQLLSAIDTTTETLQFKTAMPPAVIEGTIIGIDLEVMRVVSAVAGTNTVTVIRGYQDSDAASHGINALVDIEPRFALLDVFDAMQTEVDSWGRDLYWVDTHTYTVSPETQTLELQASWSDSIGIVDVLQSEEQTNELVWPRIKFKVIRGDLAGFSSATTSGIFLRFLEGIRQGSVYVKVARPFSSEGMTVSSDLVDDLHLSPSMLDVLEMGTRIRLIADNNDGKTAREAQDEPRRANETPVGSLVSLTQLGLARYTRRKADEMARLRALYPMRMS